MYQTKLMATWFVFSIPPLYGEDTQKMQTAGGNFKRRQPASEKRAIQ